MTTDPTVASAARDYVGQSPVFGEDSNLIVAAEIDAWHAAVGWLVSHPAEFERLRAEWTRHAQ